jgi:hypothetical protein
MKRSAQMRDELENECSGDDRSNCLFVVDVLLVDIPVDIQQFQLICTLYYSVI